MVPFGSVVFPMVGIRAGLEAIRGLRPVAVGTKGVRPVIGVMDMDESPGVAMDIGVNMERFAPGIMGTELIPRKKKTQTQLYTQ